MKKHYVYEIFVKVLIVLALVCIIGFSQAVIAEQRTYTSDADFDEGMLINLNHNPNHDQLQLNDITRPLPFINVACSARGTVVKAYTRTGKIIGEYRTAPEGRGLDPSRTTVDHDGNVWTANRGEAADNKGSVVKIGIALEGTRCNANGENDPNGGYLKDIAYNTCVDRNHDGLIRTSKGLGDILPWPDLGDGAGGADGIVRDAEDECILIYQRLRDAKNPRHVSVDSENNDVWVAGYPYEPKMFHKLDGGTGAIIDSFDARSFGCGGYGGLISYDVLWSAGPQQTSLLRYDPSTRTGICIPVPGVSGVNDTSYGLAVDENHFIWNNLWVDNTITKINPQTGIQEPGFPKPTGGKSGRGVAVTPTDNHVWGANSATNNVSRFDNNGNLLKLIPVGSEPTGVAWDYDGNVWVSNRGSNNLMRINPKGGNDGLGEVDLVVDLGAGAGPYNYSDMTGCVILGHPPNGSWSVVYDSEDCTIWDSISWNSQENSQNTITVEARTASTRLGLAAEKFTQVTNGAALNGMLGRYMEIRARFVSKAEPGYREIPILYDLTVKHHPLSLQLDIPDQEYNYGFQPIDLDDYLSFDDPAGNPDDVVWSYSGVPEGWHVEIDDENVATVTLPDGATERVNISFTASLNWNPDVCTVTDNVTFIPNHPPELTETFYCLWPPNHKYFEDIFLGDFVTDPDGDAVSIKILSITSDEPTANNPNDNKAPDADPDCIGTDTARVRAERYENGDSDGRVYAITFLASDDRGGEAELTFEVRVPLNKNDYNDGCKAVDSGQIYDATDISVREKK